MMKRVDVEVGRDGDIRFEFSGFAGDNCYEEADALRSLLREMGLWAIPVTVTPKTAGEIDLEVPEAADNRKKVPVS